MGEERRNAEKKRGGIVSKRKAYETPRIGFGTASRRNPWTQRRWVGCTGVRATARQKYAQSSRRRVDYSYGAVRFLAGIDERGECFFRASGRIRELLQLG